MNAAWLAALAWAGSAGAVGAASPERVVVHVESGALEGEQLGSLAIFKGIPYAAPPTGAWRWRPPQRVAPWSGVRQAVKFGAACPQDPALGGNPQPQAEDCLFLNVWAPAGAARGGLPVMVWIHGGGFVAGAGFQDLYYGESFARDGVVFVSLNYRLGALGFFAHPALGRGGNYGLMDHIAALEWVQRNIAAFGGNPRRVTLFGESAGGSAVLLLLGNKRASRLFQQAAAQSAPGFKKPKSRADQVAEDIKLAAAAGVPETGTLAQLRALTPEQLFGDYADVGPFVDGDLVRQLPLQAFAAAKERNLPLLLGSNSDEGSLAKIYPKSVPRLLQAMGDRAADVRAAYGSVSDDDERFGRELFGDAVFGAALRSIAASHSRRAPTFLYRFDYVSASQRDERPGAGHVSEVPYVFDTLSYWWHPPTDEDRTMAALMHGCWVSFATDGKPVCGSGWSAYDPQKDDTFVFRPGGAAMENGVRARQYDAIQTALYSK